MDATKIIILTALMAEARPIIRHFGLKRDVSAVKLPVYTNGTVQLAVSGIGKVKAATATAALLSQMDDHRNVIIMNIGICGINSPAVEIGTLFLIHKIIDAGSGQSFYPDILLKHGLPEGSLTTYDRPVTEQVPGNAGTVLADMEAAGVYSAATTFVAPHQVICLKIVSDHLHDSLRLKGADEKVESLIKKNIGAVEEWVAQAPLLVKESRKRVLSVEDTLLLESLKTTLHLTATQHIQLTSLAKGYLLRTGDSLGHLEPFLDQPVNNVQERNRIFGQVRQALLD